MSQLSIFLCVLGGLCGGFIITTEGGKELSNTNDLALVG